MGTKGIFRTLSNIYDRAFLGTTVNDEMPLPVFRKIFHHIWPIGSIIRFWIQKLQWTHERSSQPQECSCIESLIGDRTVQVKEFVQ